MSDNNIYQAPASDVVAVGVPETFTPAAITVNRLHWAAWLAIAYGLITVPIVILEAVSGAVSGEWLGLANKSLQLASTIAWIYLLFVTKQFVAVRFGLTSLGNCVNALVGLVVLMTCLSVIAEREPAGDEMSTVMIVNLVLFIPYGIATVVLGRKLLSIQEPYPYLKGLAWAIIITGICMATVILTLVAIPVSLVADVLLALLFFQGKKELAARA